MTVIIARQRGGKSNFMLETVLNAIRDRQDIYYQSLSLPLLAEVSVKRGYFASLDEARDWISKHVHSFQTVWPY